MEPFTNSPEAMNLVHHQAARATRSATTQRWRRLFFAEQGDTEEKPIHKSPCWRRAQHAAVLQQKQLGNPALEPIHFLLGLLSAGEGTAIDMLKHLNVDLGALRQVAEGATSQLGKSQGSNGTISAQAEQVLWRSMSMGQHREVHTVSTEHLLLALFEAENSRVKAILEAFGVTREAALSAYADLTIANIVGK